MDQLPKIVIGRDKKPLSAKKLRSNNKRRYHNKGTKGYQRLMEGPRLLAIARDQIKGINISTIAKRALKP
jgi:hypothetical protein